MNNEINVTKKETNPVFLQSLIQRGQAYITQCDLRGIDAATQSVGALRIDSRLVKPGDIFVAFDGGQQDGHQFLAAAVKAGAICVVVHDDWAREHLAAFEAAGVAVIQTSDQVVLMAAFSLAYRAQYSDVPIIAITGSCGKTTVKNLLGHALGQFSKPLVTYASQNNHLGVPMTMSRLTGENELGIAELGANHVGEIAAGVALVNPLVSVLTGVNSAHIEGFGSLERTAQAKGEILAGLREHGIAVLNRDDQYFDFWCRSLGPSIRVISFGLSEHASIRLVNNDLVFHKCLVEFGVPKSLIGEPIIFDMPLIGSHNRFNGMIAVAACVALVSAHSFDWRPRFYDMISSLFKGVAPAQGRLQPHQLGETLIVDDSYNATPAAVSSSLLCLGEQAGEKWFVFGGMAELGDESLSFHQRVGVEAAEAGVDQFWAFGPDASISAESFAQTKAGAIACFDTQASMKSALGLAVKKNPPGCIFLKGSRSRKMENIVQFLLEQPSSPSGLMS